MGSDFCDRGGAVGVWAGNAYSSSLIATKRNMALLALKEIWQVWCKKRLKDGDC